MNSKEWFDLMLSKGEYGEKYIIPQLPWACKCWRYHNTGIVSFNKDKNAERLVHLPQCPNPPTSVDVTKDETLWGPYDVDAKLLYNCAGCPVFDWVNAGRAAGDKDKPQIEEWHEIKTNYATHKEDLEAKTPWGTQNIYIELIGNMDSYNTGKTRDYTRGTEKIKIRVGVGWWLKNGDVKDDWYHFFQPMNDSFVYPEYADKELVRRWLNDGNVPDGAVLMLKWPFSYCLSITGEYLKEIIRLGNMGKKKRYEPRLTSVKNNGRWVRQKVHLIPVGDILPCVALNPNPKSEIGKQRLKEDGIMALAQGGDFEWLGRFYDKSNVVAFIGGDSVVVKGDEKQIGNFNRLYVPQALYDEALGATTAEHGISKLNGEETASGEKLVVPVGITKPEWHFYKEGYEYGGNIIMPKLEFDEVARAEIYR